MTRFKSLNEEEQPVIAEHETEQNHSTFLNENQQQWISTADTCFIATQHPDDGGDISHRGGNSGFIKVENVNTLLLPDYSGNHMFNSLGNIEANSHAGLLFPHFTNGDVLQLTGRAVIEWDTEELRGFHGAERLVRFYIDEVIQSNHVLQAKFQFGEYSPFNPK